eukprot:PITA_34096
MQVQGSTAPSAEAKTTSDEGGDVYLASSSSTHVDHEAWLIDLGASFHFTSHREWVYKYDKYDGGDVFLRDDRKARIVGCRKVKFKLQGGRIRTLPNVLHIFALARNLIYVRKMDDAGLKIVREEIDSKDEKLWKEAMVDEMASLDKNEAWDLVALLAGRKPIGRKWVFKKKMNVEGKVEKYKAWLVEKSYSQVSGIDFDDIFSPFAKVAYIILLLFVFVAFDFEVEWMDVKITFLHGDLEEEIYMN